MFVFRFGKSVPVFGFLRFSLYSFVCLLRNYPVNLAFRMTGVEDTHITLAAILFQAEVDNSLNFFHYITEESCRVSVPVESIIL